MTDVTQEDREAAAPHSPRGHGTIAGYTFSASYMIRNGHWDDDPLVQAFAAHRQSTQSSLAAENERLRAALRSVAWAPYYDIKGDMVGNGCEHGFKPAASCPNEGCEKGALERVIDAALKGE